jgi:hypothetical protein
MPLAGHQLHRDVQQTEGDGAAPDGSCGHDRSPSVAQVTSNFILPAKAGIHSALAFRSQT